MQPLPPILFEDEALVAFDKPSGLLVAPDRWDKERENLMQQVHDHLSPDIFNVHRLDFETSGVLLCTKTKSALDRLSGQFQSKQVQKRYLAIVRGGPPQDEMVVQLPIAEDPRQVGKMRVSRSLGKPVRRGQGLPRPQSSAKPCETRIRLLTRWRGYSFLEVFPITGRTHQIRVHLAFLRCPVLADPVYGHDQGLMLSEIKRRYKVKKEVPERPLLGRLGLHAESLTFTHPTTNQPLTIQSPLPKAFEVAIKYLKRFAGV